MRRALAFLTTLGGAATPDGQTLTWFPVIGAGIGATVGAVWWVAAQIWPPVVAAGVVVAADLALTGMLHVDGLIDAADGLLPHLSRERRLVVMDEPAVGAYGVAVGGVALLLRFAAFAAVSPHIGLVAATWCASRTVMAVAIRALPYARSEGGLASAMVGGSWGGVAAIGGLGAVAIALTAGWRAELAVVACVASAAAVVMFGRRQLGGFTGDVIGAAGVVGETVALLVAAAKEVRGALMVCGTASDAGKSHVVAGLCRALFRRGVRVAPFKAQNMSLNSYVTASGHEIGRAQAAQALAAGVAPDVAMNPILLKPTSDTDCQVIVMGEPVGHVPAAQYHHDKPDLFEVVLGALADVRSRFDVVILEGAGSAAEINLLDRDIVNLPVAVAAGIKAIVVGDIDRGGVFAALHGTVALLPADQRACVGGFIINKLRGDPTLLLNGTDQLEGLTGIRTLGVLPFVNDVALDAEDSLAFSGPPARPAGAVPTVLDVTAIRWPQVANATDLDPLAIEPGVGVRWVDHAAALGRPDLIVLPGSKATISDLAWLRATGLDTGIAASDAAVLGICAGYQALGQSIADPAGVEAPAGSVVAGLGWLDVETTFGTDKVLAQRQGVALDAPVHGYEIHHGRTGVGERARPWMCLDSTDEGAIGSGDRAVFGTNLHGLFESDVFRRAFLLRLAALRGVRFTPSTTSFGDAREAQLDHLGDLIEDRVDLAAIQQLIEAAA